jgi:hypothetical protein
LRKTRDTQCGQDLRSYLDAVPDQEVTLYCTAKQNPLLLHPR